MKEKRSRSQVTPRRVTRVGDDYRSSVESVARDTEYAPSAIATPLVSDESSDWIEEVFADLNHTAHEPPRRRDPYNRVQERFLGRCVRERARVEIITRDENVRQGMIRAFDRWTLLMQDGNRQWLMFKNSILTISRQDGWNFEPSLPEYDATMRLLSDVRSHYTDHLTQ
ncbi:MAG: RNA chaperone Hfq [Bacillota bacterium]|nr:RNA chaperone Hfq [Bacillota bacterium]